MPRKLIPFALSALLAIAVASATAEEVISPEARLKEATDVVTGRVLGVYARDVAAPNGRMQTRHVVEILVDAIEKGSSIEAKDVIYVRAWNWKDPPRNSAETWAGDSYYKPPGAGSRVRAFCVRGDYDRTGQKDKGLSGVFNEPFVVLAEEKKEPETPPK